METSMTQIDLAEPPETAVGESSFISGLKAILGDSGVLCDEPGRVFFSTDIFVRGTTAELVIRPESTDQLAKAIAYCTQAGRAVVPRGGGFSYTQGYVPVRENSVTLDMQGMTEILEINTQDLWVKVQVGATWRSLYEALKEKGYRTPYFGPVSGYHSTVGGALSQGSFFLGSTQYGTTADTVLALEVVLADGTILTTGSAGSVIDGSPFMRNYGPDLTGLFLHDAGALAAKAAAYLKLIPFPKHSRYASFGFEQQVPGIAALSDIARQGLAAECYLWDPVFVKSLRERGNLGDDLRFLKGVVSSGSSILAGLKDAARIALAGKRVFDGNVFLLHVTIDDVSSAGAEERLKLVRTLAASHGGAEVVNSIPRALRASPFNDFIQLGQQTPYLRTLPVHGLFPHSKAQDVCTSVQKFFAERSALMEQHGITQGTICFAVGSTMVGYEPVISWEDKQLAAHDRVKMKSDLETLAKFSERPVASQTVAAIRQDLVSLFTEAGAGHCQIGKAYRYRQTRQPQTYALLQSIKNAVDPHGLMNPGSLGLV